MSEYLQQENNPAPSKTNNPFAGVITAQLHWTYTNAIDALLQDCSLVTPCRFVFAGAQLVECPNCVGTLYKPNGPFPFPKGKICPACQGRQIPVEENEDVSLMLIYDSRKWLILNKRIEYAASTNVPLAATPNMFMETMCRIELYPKIKACKHLIADTCNENYSINQYNRVGEPKPLGLGKMEYIITAWRRTLG